MSSAVRRIIHDQYVSANAKVQFVSICDKIGIPNLEELQIE